MTEEFCLTPPGKDWVNTRLQFGSKPVKFAPGVVPALSLVKHE